MFFPLLLIFIGMILTAIGDTVFIVVGGVLALAGFIWLIVTISNFAANVAKLAEDREKDRALLEEAIGHIKGLELEVEELKKNR